ncbi:hypothetical protein SAMN05216387_103291 [Nitrosovibrio tenuis]|uniref:Uncharacterized protein n=1 Tax=Nitrosovibrio tenuis TaxID=1233 RepID=A0A1H7KNT5_9PROT|nr:hypothetical protein SAMN05216387_103291 [Nitrosovibrio tenuis]
MRKIVGRATAGALSFLNDCIGTFISFSGSPRLCPLYLKLSKALAELQDWTSRSRKTSAPMEHEGLGVAYDKRKWMENYYGNRPIQS